MPTQELSTSSLSPDPPDVYLSPQPFTVPSTEQLLLYHGPELFTNVVSVSPVAHLVVSIDGRIMRINRVFRDLTGYADGPLIGLPLESIVAAGSRSLTRRMLGRLRDRQEPATEWSARVLTSSHEEIPFSFNAVVVWVAGRPSYITIFARSVALPQGASSNPDPGDRFRSLVERIPAVTYISSVHDGPGMIYVSPQIEPFLGYEQAHWLARPSMWNDVIHPDDRERVLGEIEQGRVEQGRFQIEHRVVARDGRTLWVRNEATLMHDEAGAAEYWHGVVHDITERKQIEEALGVSEARFRTLVQNSSGVVLVVAPDGMLLYASPALQQWSTPRQPAPSIGDSSLSLLHPDDVGRFRQFLIESAESTDDAQVIEVRFGGPSGSVRHIEAIATNLLDDPNVAGIVLNTRDVTERKDLEENLSHQAFHDPLTDLPNRALFLDRLERALERALRQKRVVAVLYVDVDNFKLINDNLGHEIGDMLLVTVATRLRECVRGIDTVSRLGGDEFTVLLEDLADLAGAIDVADRITKAIQQPVLLPNNELVVTASIGIAHNVTRQTTPQDLLSAADIALYRAKNLGKARYAVFERGMTAPIHQRLELEHDLRRAVEHGEIQAHFQPVVELTTGFVRGVEALARWNHPERGILFPDEFVAISESTGLIFELGQQVLDQSCQQLKLWQEHDSVVPPLSLSINLSAYQLRRESIVSDISKLLERSQLSPSCLIIEINEALILENSARAVSVLRSMKREGFRLFIDDFGTGYSSLAYLRRFPVDGIKIDRSFIDGIERNPQNQALVAAIIAAGQALHLDVIAEGIETIGQLAELRSLGCLCGQGHLFAAPGTAEEISPLVRRRVLLPQVRFKRDQSRRLNE